ncbi:protein FAR1-RELATED SEQUENCE 5-like [Aegilops tauschii subsp. strangulata]|uniref:protein FAR1-RELATED SEQUENCE 5-like n=1 Tax=Aegilops tauschii subsp. strangulata TaxID=200361 RepID=UPI001E1CAA93|nr:protein FAR1-RELATED SEQUENCE 5-like [Aegilops tauschii subsp. strangulata]
MDDEVAACTSHVPSFPDDMSLDGGLGDDSAAAGSSHGPSFTDGMSFDDVSDNGKQADAHGKNKNVCDCDDQQEGGPVQQENVEHLSQEDILIFIQNDSVCAAQAQTCSQEVRSHHVPYVGMVFDSCDAAHAFYNEYAAICGFAIKKAGNYHATKPGGKAVSRYTYRCNRSGKVVGKDVLEERKKQRQLKKQEKTGIPPPEKAKRKRKNFIQITGCQAKMIATLKGDKWVVTSVDLEHNHTLSPPDESKYLRSHKKMTEEEKLFIRTFNSVQMPTRKIMAILSYLRGGDAPYTKKYVSNVRTAINRENGKGDMLQVLEYFRNKQKEDPNFYYAFKVADEDINKVLCIFWADGYSRKMYELYGDCLSFDTTYKTNRYNMPFAPFVGITGHGLNCLFACAIVHNETVDTFEWLFDTFLDCMRRKAPLTVITDQDVAMKTAVPAVFKGVVHRCCLFHIMKKVRERCVRTFSTQPDLYADFSDIMHNCLTEAEFETLWPPMTEKYGVENVKYFRYMWKYRELFVPVYFKKSFFPFIHSTARSEGTNAIFKDNVGSTFSVITFLREYERILKAMQENEKEQDSITRTTKPTYWLGTELELQAAEKYNRAIFYIFQKVIKFASQLHVEEVEKNTRYEVYKKDFRIRRYVVIVDMHREDFACICGKFEKDGVVCSHILRVLTHLNLPVLPEKYYIDRWRPKQRKDIRKLRYGVPEELTAGDHHLRYMLLSSRLNEMASDAASSNEKYMYVVGESVRIEAKLDEMTLAEEQQKMQDKHVERAPAPTMVTPHPDGYGESLKDPDVIASKGRPQERYKTFLEKIQAKQQIGCSHCGQHDHVFASCTNKHIPRSQFHKKTTVGKQPTGVPGASKDSSRKSQTGGGPKAGDKRSAQKDTTSAPSASKGMPSKKQTGGKQKTGEKRSARKDTTGAS